MAKKVLLVLILAVFAAAGVFAQSDYASMAKNTITVDVGPTIIGFAFGKAADFIGDEGLNSGGFGIAGQYERQLSRPLSVAGRFAYLKADMGILVEEERDGGRGKLTTDVNLASLSAEGHVRFYPFGDTFFLDGMLGYANLKTDVSGSIKVEASGRTETESVSFTGSRNYIKLGAKLGWRMSFGKNGGFTFEPALGYSFGIGLGDSIGDKLAEEIGGEAADFDDIFSRVEQFVFIGGPRLSLAFGYRF
jgi:hypothetical protein